MPLPLSQQIVIDTITPPILAGIAWLLGHSWARVFEGSNPSEGTLRWIRRGFWIMLIALYAIMFSTTAYYQMKVD